MPSTPVTGVPVINSTPRLVKLSVARWISVSGRTGKIFGPASTSLILRSAKLTPCFAAIFGKLSTISPTSSTPVKPPPPITIVASASSLDCAYALMRSSICLLILLASFTDFRTIEFSSNPGIPKNPVWLPKDTTSVS
ncbi:hypothetical protein D9M71_724240 [compost metagenome]